MLWVFNFTLKCQDFGEHPTSVFTIASVFLCIQLMQQVRNTQWEGREGVCVCHYLHQQSSGIVCWTSLVDMVPLVLVAEQLGSLRC